MLRKVRIAFNEKESIVPTLPVAISINSIEEFEDSLSILKNHKHPLKGLELPLSLARKLDLSLKDITYLSIHLDSELQEKELSKYLQKNRFIEIFLPEKFYHCLSFCKDAGRIVLETNNLSKTNSFFSEMIAMARYPLVKGMPFCHVPMEHCFEFYDSANLKANKKETNENIQLEKPKECNSCLFIAKCPGPNKLLPKPITDIENYKQALEFVRDENTAARF